MAEIVLRGAPRIVINPTDGTPSRPATSGGAVAALYCITEYFPNSGYTPADNGAAATATILGIYQNDLGFSEEVTVTFVSELRNHEPSPSAPLMGVRQWESYLTAEQAAAVLDNYIGFSGGDSITVELDACAALTTEPEAPQGIEFLFDFDATNYIWRFTYSIDKNFLVGEPAAAKKNIALFLNDTQTIKINISNNSISNDGSTPGWVLSNATAAGTADGVVYLYIPIAVFNANAPTATAFDYDVKVKDPNDVFSTSLTGTINI